jgi:hypothetical protein
MKKIKITGIFVWFVVLFIINAPVYLIVLLIKGITIEDFKSSCKYYADLENTHVQHCLRLLNVFQLKIATVLVLVYLFIWWLV